MIKPKNIRNLRTYIIFAGIPTLAFLTVVILPFIYGVYLTFTDFNAVETVNQFLSKFVGLSNYVKAISDSAFRESFLKTFKYVFYTMVFTNLIAFFLAYILTSGIKGQNFFRVAFFTPNLIGGIILGFIWQFIFNSAFPYIGYKLNIPLFYDSWLATPQKAFWALVTVTVWQYVGYMMMIYIAGFVSIPQDLLEAATIDGAGKWHKLVRIILPLMVPSFTVTIFLTLQRSFMVYDLNLALTRGGPFKSTELVSMHVYNEAFLYQRYAIGQAKALILFITVALITMIQVYFSKKAEVEI
ncbi:MULTISPECIES: carbohydrate ABC transporter permease [Dictyoglomus]|jgi:raffinose/stachyose/melibiose transport system permease protein|uniref:Binding-protein-dependent transport systems inner membrane component n=1 Tax=Dictyoglomus turgidum (strain DSM 6724 / Z-1310) TaxID=515635 RepID=B8DZA6_DICTD|nr:MULTISPECIES: sugar ABC transporter permease [Dictyoglomus]ACK41839.1 binding-protein-dependent transport systems inner membrane component [Dictyoglomus turgidum DSM 6724]PNV79724.1 MAG: sugar ABC transporter permease [Dictyoglomus turgidum]HBU31306.1 sugar ABC transporter permease [Dictyoglomus sp.]